MVDEMMKYFKVIGEIQSEIQKTDNFDEAIKVGVQKVLQAFPSEYAIIWYKEEEYLHPYYWRGSISVIAERLKRLSINFDAPRLPKITNILLPFL